VTYDLVEYCLCEHRRLICSLRKRREKGKGLKSCHFLVTHQATVAKMRRGMIAYLLKKLSFKP
jgi:hypothetical protein